LLSTGNNDNGMPGLLTLSSGTLTKRSRSGASIVLGSKSERDMSSGISDEFEGGDIRSTASSFSFQTIGQTLSNSPHAISFGTESGDFSSCIFFTTGDGAKSSGEILFATGSVRRGGSGSIHLSAGTQLQNSNEQGGSVGIT
jgi:hypothetical protein